MSPAAQAVVQRLDSARQRWWLFTLLSTTVLAGCLSFGVLLVLMAGDALLKFSQLWLAAFFLGWLGLTGTLSLLVGRRLSRSQRGLEATARRVEAELPELESHLINLVQLSEDTRNGNRAFCAAAVNEAAARIGARRFEGAADKEPRWRRFLYCMQTPRDLAESLGLLGLLILVAVICGLMIPNWGSAATRLLSPWEFVPSVGSVGQIEVAPGNTEVLVGSSLPITAEVENPEARPLKATLFVTPEEGQEQRLPMAAVDEEQRRFTLTLPSVLGPLKYRVEIGDSQSAIYRVGVREKPTVRDVTVTLRFPAYLRRDPETFEQQTADLEGPQYSTAELAVRPSVPIAEGHVLCRGRRIAGRVEQNGGLLRVKLPLDEDGTFTIHLLNDRGHGDPDPRVNRIRVLPDKPPTVELKKPPRQSTSAAGAEVPVMILAGDDHGLERLRLEVKVKPAADGEGVSDTSGEDAARSLQGEQWTGFGDGDTTVVRHHALVLSPDDVRPGETVLVRAVAWDGRRVPDLTEPLEPQQAASPWHTIELVAEDAQAAAELAELDGLRNKLWQIFQKQVRARAGAAGIPGLGGPAQRGAAAAETRNGQIEVQKSSDALVKSIGKTDDDERLKVKRILSNLAYDEMLKAVEQSDALAGAKTLEAFDAGVPGLLTTQDRIIEVLRGLLDVARNAQSEMLAEMKRRQSGDLPPDVVEKLEEARRKLDEFLKQQKKVIEASEDLAKRPVEDFSEEEEQKLKELAAVEDDWSKFMKELHTDLSKLPEQDFANPALLEELVEIQTELKMAEDALLKKTADIAVPLEQLGAEMAEEIRTNLEKWLPDTPDREKWSQEESLTDEAKEAPMAELPGELEDLIGELMEEEEDLFDEMEDVSSSAADSLDKGAGWDVADGPISNMSAKGATGNRLPNTSEIGGRAGEGRSGKSSGEFVGEEAVGKGGRKTPSRLTPDPYVKGQIKDHSKDGQGGATGGGKESGQGGEGLEGPQRRPPGQRELERLAGKQAALRNKAEGVDAQFEIMNYHHTDLKNLIDVMARVEEDLRAGRYQNALRQRKVLAEGLGNVKQYLEGEFELRRDATANLPSDVQKEILGSMKEPSPVGWEEMNREYFRRLTGAGREAPAGENEE